MAQRYIINRGGAKRRRHLPNPQPPSEGYINCNNIRYPSNMAPSNSLRAFIYCRVSTREQSADDHYSLGNQEQRCRDYLKMKQWRLVCSRKDVAGGKDDSRDGFQQLKAALGPGSCRGIWKSAQKL